MNKEHFMADLYELKKSLIRPFHQESRFIEPNTTYCVIETLIAVFMDKYKVRYEDVMEVLRERRLTNLDK